VIKADKKKYDLVIKFLMKNRLNKKQSAKVAGTLISVSKTMMLKYRGKIQTMLRLFGKVLKIEMIRTFKNSPLSKSEIDFAVTLWLQNALDIPLSLMQPELLKFCRSQNIGFDELINAADEIDLNMAVLDDVLVFVTNQKKSKKLSLV